MVLARPVILTPLLFEADFFVDEKDLQTFVSAASAALFFGLYYRVAYGPIAWPIFQSAPAEMPQRRSNLP
ncbi:protein of unknown function [Paraburkholderia kururiensis]